jgi:hypothetical protein
MNACHTVEGMRAEVMARLEELLQQTKHKGLLADACVEVSEEVIACAKILVTLDWVEKLTMHLGSEWTVLVGYGDLPEYGMVDMTIDHTATEERWLGMHDAGTLSLYDTCVDYVDGTAASDYPVMDMDSAGRAARHLRTYHSDRMPSSREK